MNTKRITAFVLAGLMLMGTVGYIFSMIASAATVNIDITHGIKIAEYRVLGTSGTSNVLREIKKDDTFTLELTLEGTTAEGQGLLKAIGSSGDAAQLRQTTYFQAENGSKATMKAHASAENTYILTITQLKYIKDDGKKIELTLKTSPAIDFSFEISECTKDSSGGSSSDSGNTEEPDDTPSSGALTARYEVVKVKDTNGKTKFDATNPDNRADSSIRHGYTAVIRAKVIDPNGTAAQIAAATAKTDISNFSGGSVKIITDDPNYPVKDVGGGVQYYLEFSTGKYSGTGRTLAAVVEGENYYAEVTASIGECVEYRDTTSSNDDNDYSDLAVATPYVIISNYSYGGKEVTAGETITLSLTLYNTSANVDVQNMMVTVSMPEDLMLTASSNTFYVANLATQESVTKSIQVTAKPAAAAQSHNIGVSMKYQYIDHHTNARRDNTTEETIAIPVVQVDRFQVTGIETQQEVSVGEEGLVTVNFVNKGRSEVYNISAEISGNIQNPGQQQNLGNLASGATGSVDFYPIPTEGGPVTGQVTITYEDTNMVEKTITIDYSANAISFDDMMGGGMPDMGVDVMDPGMVPEEESKSPAPWVIGGIVVAGAVAAFVIKKKMDKKRSEAADADL